ncbi:Fic family protein [Nocardioides sp. TRM66260-LWL]|uniref:type II toxin-antitoxin system death-on-curing family toxin n=1 Tax=Nocardioides sp. TRM66260-LWL TaxID=2874478 RepID=UPI001CC72E16|nr:Fic family protein [Nocardioides sp. TRM66260-LWL]MBZ5736513.1 Fic family protein [Nocardioides sp. TRM66260-LWL]
MPVERLSLEVVGEINRRLGGGGLSAADRGAVEGALLRPFSGFGDHELFPTLWDKAGAMLHGLASTQAFADGNKRTAWLAALALLELNGIQLPVVPDVEAEAFVLSVATVQDFAADRAAEWFRSVHGRSRVGYASDPRLEYLVLAIGAWHEEGGLLSLDHAHLFTIEAREIPGPVFAWIAGRIHWRDDESPEGLSLTVQIDGDDKGRRIARPLPAFPYEHSLGLLVPTGHAHHQRKFMPTTFAVPVGLSAIQPGRVTLHVAIGGQHAGSIPISLIRSTQIPSDTSGL